MARTFAIFREITKGLNDQQYGANSNQRQRHSTKRQEDAYHFASLPGERGDAVKS